MAKILNIDGSVYNQYFYQILDNTRYRLHVYYNARSGWYIDFYDADLYDTETTDNSDALIYGGRKLIPNQNILERSEDSRLPAGQLICYDTDLKPLSQQESIVDGKFGTGNRYQIIYFSEEDIANF